MPRNYAQRKNRKPPTALTPTAFPVWCTVPTAGQEWAIPARKPSTAVSFTILIPLFNAAATETSAENRVSHFIKTSVLEAAVLQSIQTVSKYVLENEEEFISQLKALWNEQKQRHIGSGQQELEEAGKWVQELDGMIQNLYESSMKGLLPERQVQRMIQQYDEEQILLERRIKGLQEQIQQEEVKKVDTERFVALVKKYRDCEELTDTMLYAFIDRIEVHEATGGRTIYRQQKIDIYFNFIGNYYPPVETISKEERRAAIEAEQLRKRREKGKRSAERRKQKLDELRKAAEAGDEEAIAQYAEYLEKQKERGRRYRQKLKEAKEADPEHIRQMEEKECLKREKVLEAERKRIERAKRSNAYAWQLPSPLTLPQKAVLHSGRKTLRGTC